MAKVTKTSSSGITEEVVRGTILECLEFWDKHAGVLIDEKGSIWLLSIDNLY